MCKSQLEGNGTIAKSGKHPKLSLIGDLFARVPRKKFEVSYSYRCAGTKPESVTRLCPAAIPNERPSRLHSTASSRLRMWKRKTRISLARITYLCILSPHRIRLHAVVVALPCCPQRPHPRPSSSTARKLERVEGCHRSAALKVRSSRSVEQCRHRDCSPLSLGQEYNRMGGLLESLFLRVLTYGPGCGSNSFSACMQAHCWT
jgi:hypothetical protein